jgi:hypothetical protein
MREEARVVCGGGATILQAREKAVAVGGGENHNIREGRACCGQDEIRIAA